MWGNHYAESVSQISGSSDMLSEWYFRLAIPRKCGWFDAFFSTWRLLAVMVSLEELKNKAGSKICHENRDWVATGMRYDVFKEKTVTGRKICPPPTRLCKRL